MTLTLACYFPAEKPMFMAIKMEPDAWVDQLLYAIQERFQLQRPEVDLDDLRLFKVKVVLSMANSQLTHKRPIFFWTPRKTLVEGLGDPDNVYKRKVKKGSALC